MKTWTLARVMWLVGVLGWGLLALALVWSLRYQLDFIFEQEGTLGFMGLFLVGAFLVGLSLVWIGLFALLSNRSLEGKPGRGGSTGGVGFGIVVAMVVGVLLTSAAPPLNGLTFSLAPPSVQTVLAAGLVVLAVFLWRASLWIANYRRRCEDAEP